MRQKIQWITCLTVNTKNNIFERLLYRGFQIMFARFSVKHFNVFRK